MDRSTERQVWQRVYSGQNAPAPMTAPQRQQLRRSLDRAEANLRFYESRRNDPVYREAFAHLADQTREHCKMLRQMLRR